MSVDSMTMPKGNDLSKKEIDSMEIAVKEASITAIHPDRMEAFADYLVQKLQNNETRSETKTCDCTCASGKSSCINRGDGV
jgi:hypothetical protein